MEVICLGNGLISNLAVKLAAALSRRNLPTIPETIAIFAWIGCTDCSNRDRFC